MAMSASSSSRALLRRIGGALLCRSFSATASAGSDSAAAAGYHVAGGPSYMRGAVFWEPGRPLTLEEFQMPRPKAGELLIKTKACGVCHSDLHVMKGEIPFSSPRVVGHEITGEVVDHGTHTPIEIVNRFPIGSHVVGAFIMPCGNCFYCVKGQEDLCESFFAYNRAKGTLYDGETRLFLRNGKPVYMYSMGGLADCLQIAKAFGASEVIAVDVLDEKLQNARTLGATHTVNAAKEDAVERIKEITDGRGVDVAVEALGKALTFAQCTKSVRDGGKAVMIGLAATNVVGEVKIIGSYGARARQDLPQIVKLAESGAFNLQNTITRKCKFEEANDAYEDLNQGKIVGRAVVEIME
ncbi:uncharacterized protein C2845_PM13G00630 [Panicum miliaceum]|uniref:Enoyl reductase (ER) domain-containing protein n=1 Tax=Panicum miliaceum TaxID=4540 RepID=A0A3L6RIR5_PANMI|nr:uncharacterized protein C2845_PM13G00630 [Panicum miliaceum]